MMRYTPLLPRLKSVTFCMAGMVLLAGCATQEELNRIRQDQANADMRQCAEYGLHPESEAFANCRMQLDMQRRYPPYTHYEPYPRFYTGFGYRRW